MEREESLQARSMEVETEAATDAAHLEFRQLFEANFPYVWTSLRRLGVDERDIEDLAHDLFLEVHKKLASYDRARPIRPWLFAFAARFAADFRKQARVRRQVWGDVPDHPDARPTADELISAGEDRALVREGLRAIDVDRRDVFILHEIDEVTIPEVAASLGIPLNTAYSRLRLAREEFAAAVRKIQSRPASPDAKALGAR